MHICLFEDERSLDCAPLSVSRPVYDLRCGILPLAEKLTRRMPKANVQYLCRTYLEPVVQQRKGKIFRLGAWRSPVLFLNGRILADDAVVQRLLRLKVGTVAVSGKEVLAAHLGPEHASAFQLGNGMIQWQRHRLRRIHVRATLIHYLWDIVHHNPEAIVEDAKLLYGKFQIQGAVHSGSHLVERSNIHIAEGASVLPGVVIDATDGPVILERKAKVLPNAVLMGPLFIGEGSIIKAGAKIYGGTTIGPVCKVGGEVEESILHGYSNKQHEGFLGHAYIGMWCNLGADTNNSDLKNNYSSVDVFVHGKKVDTGQTFVGLFLGDHAKSGINTMFNTGTVAGFSSNVFGAGYLPKAIPAFSWFNAQAGSQTYKLDKAIEVAKRVMARRHVQFTANDRKLFHSIFQLTESERKAIV